MKTSHWLGTALAVAVLAAACGGSDPVPPTLLTDLADPVVGEGGSTSLGIDALGDAPMQYQWLRNGNAIGGATAATLAVGPVRLVDAGTTYAVQLSNAVGELSSRTATLTVTPRAWTATPLTTSVASEGSAIQTASVVDGQGNITVAFDGPSGSSSRPGIWVGRLTAGSNTLVTSYLSGSSQSAVEIAQKPRIAVDASGRTMVVWEVYNTQTGKPRVMGAIKAWGAGADADPGELAPATANPRRDPDVAAAADGTFDVVWREASLVNGLHDIVARRINNGGTGAGAVTVLDADPNDATEPRIASDGAGRSIAVWTRSIAGAPQVMSQERTATAAEWNTSANAVMNSGVGADPYQPPQIRMQGSQGASAFRDTAGRVFVQRLTPSGWSAPQYVANWAANIEPGIAVAADGHIAIASLAVGTGQGTLYQWTYDPVADTWSSPTVVHTASGTDSIYKPVVAFDAAGNTVTAWSEYNTGNGSTWGAVLRARRHVAGIGWLTTSTVSGGGFESFVENREATMVVGADGSAFAFWFRADGVARDNTPRYAMLR